MAVQNWTWWKLYTKVLPLLDVHRTEEELKSKTVLFLMAIEKLFIHIVNYYLSGTLVMASRN